LIIESRIQPYYYGLCRCETGKNLVVYLKYELKDVIISSYSVNGESREHAPSETLSLNYEEIKVTYTEVDSKGQKKGKVEYHWKVEEGAI